MKRRKKSFVLIIFAISSICSIVLTGFSFKNKDDIPIPSVKENTYIYDDDHIIDDNIEKNLNAMLVELEEKTEVEFVIISVKDLLGNNIETYANKVFNTLGIGKKDKDNGVLLLFSKSDVRVRLEIGRGLEGILNDAKCGRILDNYFVPYREEDNEDYDTAVNLTVQAVIKIICEEYDVTIENLDIESLESLEEEEMTLGDLISTIFIILVICIMIEWITGHILGDGFGDGIIFMFIDSSSSGYSGGYSSVGGGFGGGSSGGGGATR